MAAKVVEKTDCLFFSVFDKVNIMIENNRLVIESVK